MEWIKKLSKYQKIILLALVTIVAVYTVAYAVTISKVGYLYQGIVFVPEKIDGATVYSANYRGSRCRFIVSDDNSVVFETDSQKYGPYYFNEDPTAIPAGNGFSDLMTGLEVRYQEKVIFRGGVVKVSTGQYWVYNEDGKTAMSSSPLDDNWETIVDENGKAIDKNTLLVCGITDLMTGPELRHKGSWLAWFGSVVYCVFVAAIVIFHERLFRFDLSLRIRDYEKAEPSDWELATRYLSWALLTLMAAYLFNLGLQPDVIF